MYNVKCDNCLEAKAEVICSDCKMYLCLECSNQMALCPQCGNEEFEEVEEVLE